MKKRILCAMLTLIMLVSLIPVGAISASAASLKISEAAITVLKKMTEYKFVGNCYRVSDTQQFRIGYGTPCKGRHTVKLDGSVVKEGKPETHKMNEYQADLALREALGELDKKVNSFASNNGLSMKQNQHDALVVFSYGVGTAWMDGNGVVKTAIVNGAGTNELLAAMATVDNDMERRKIEVNMYVNGIYSNVVVDTFKKVVYDANGSAAEPAYMVPHDDGNKGRYTMQFDSSEVVSHIPTPTRAGYTFMGWYLGNEWKPNLTDDCAYVEEDGGPMLLAKWQVAGLEPKDAWKSATQISYTMPKSKLVSEDVFSRPDGDEDYLLEDAEIEYDTLNVYREYIAPDGARWALIDVVEVIRYDEFHKPISTSTIKGWVMTRVGSDGAPSGSNGTHAEVDVTVTVTNSFVNSRKNASIYSAKNGSYSQGAKLRIINTASADGYLWGQIAKSATDNTPIGWVALMYTNWNSVKDNGNTGNSNNTVAIGRATINFNGYVNLRSGAGTDNKIVGSLAKNETVNVYEIKTVNGHQWGRTEGGWFCLTYASLTMLGDNKNDMISNEGALNYVFTGDATEDLSPRVSPSDSAEYTQHYYEYEDEDDIMNPKKKMDIWPKKGESVTIANMMVERDSTLWVKISWRVDLDRDGEKDTTKSGWVKMTGNQYTIPGGSLTAHLSLESRPVSMDPARFRVVADEVTVRYQPNSGAEALTVKLNKGVDVKVNAIQLVGENMWGYMESEHVADGDSTYANCDGWINLASKYVTRSNAPVIENDEDNSSLSPIGKTATIVGTDSVNVRITGSTSGKIIGKMSRGTKANVLEISDNGKWYNLDVDVDKNPKTGSWVSKDYLEINDGYVGGSNGSGSNKPEPVITGKGVVANTYSGVNVRSGAGQSYAQVGKLLPGTVVDVLEIKQGGAAKWARIAQGWVCMDYITMLSEEVTYPEGTPSDDGSTIVGSYDEIDRTTTTAVYTGHVRGETPVYAEPVHEYTKPGARIGENIIRKTLNPGEQVTIYELLSVTEIVDNDGVQSGDGSHGATGKVTVTSYWARTNDGYIYNPHDNIDLDALDEKVHTLTGSETLKVRPFDDVNQKPDIDGTPLTKMKKGDQVKVTALEIVFDKVWGRVDFEGYTGWIRLDYMSEGAYREQEKKDEPTTPPANNGPIIGAGGDNGGFVNNGSGYRYTGRIINTNQVNVRATASTSAKVTTTLKSGAALVIYETTTAENMAWGRCDAGWVYLYYVDLTPVTSNGAIDSRVVANNVPGIIYTDSSCSDTVGTYAGMSVVDVFEIVGDMARTEKGWVSVKDFL